MVLVLRVTKRLGLFILTIFSMVFSVGCINFNYENNNGSNNNSNNEVRETDKINLVYQYLRNHYYSDLFLDIDEIESVEELLSYTDPYTGIYEQGSTNIEKGETFVGYGLTFIDDKEGLLVVGVNDEVDLHKKIFTGDIIIKIDGIVLKDLTYYQKTSYLKPELNKKKPITIKRLNKELDLILETTNVPFPSVIKHNFYGIGYIEITRFGSTTYDIFLNTLNALENSNINGLIIDVRNNGGGYLDSVYNILKLFIGGEDPMFHLFYPKRNEYISYYPEEDTLRKPYPITILINQNSASASEVFAGVMQQNGYKLIGEKTYGKDVFQSGHKLPAPFKANQVLNITHGYWLLKNNESASEGIYPDKLIYESGIRTLIEPTLTKEYKKGESSPYIGVYQYLINLTVTGDFIPNYFDDNFENMIKIYQNNNSLIESGILDEETLISLIIYYKEIKKDKSYDDLLNEALQDMENKINGN